MKYQITMNDMTEEEFKVTMAKLSNLNMSTVAAAPAGAPAIVGGFTAPAAQPAFPPITTTGAPTVEEVEQPSAVNVAGVVDADNLPWDSRIHSSNKKQTDKGFWVKRRNVNDTTYNQVVGELRSRVPAAPAYNPPPAAPFNNQPPYVAPAGAPAYNPPPAVPAAPPYGAPAAAPMAVPAFLQNVPQANAGPVNQPPAYSPPPAQPPVQQDINALFGKISQLFSNGQADANYVLSVQQRLSQQFQVQVNSINDIASRPDMIAAAFNLIAQDGK